MLPLPSRKVLEGMKRVDLQKLCKDYGVKANLKSESLIQLLLDTESAATSKRNAATSNKPSLNRRSASTRQSSRAGPSRATSMTIHEMDGKDGRSKRHSHADNGGPDLPERSIPEPPRQQLSSTAAPSIRAPKAKELQRRLGVGKPFAAGGAGPRTVTRSTTLSKGKQTKPSRALKAEATIPEEETVVEPSIGPASQGKNNEIAEPVIPMVSVPSGSLTSLASLTVVDEHVAKALRPLHEQLQALRSELEQIHLLKEELAVLKNEVESLKSRTPAARDVNAITSGATNPQLQGSGVLGVPSAVTGSANHYDGFGSLISNAAYRSQNTLGKRSRESSTPSTEEHGAVEKYDDAPAPKRAKTSRSGDHDFTVGVIDESNPMKKIGQSRETTPQESHTPGFTIFQEPNEQPEAPRLSDYFIIPSPSGTVSAPEDARHETTNGPENQNPFAFPFSQIPSTPNPQLNPHQQTHFSMPVLPYLEAPRSPTPNASGPGRNTENGNGAVGREQTDAYRSFGLPPGRPTSRVPSTINPTVLTTGKEIDAPITSNEVAAGLGLRTVSSSFIAPTPLDSEDAPPMRVTMYGTELDSDTRFGDFGVEGVATGFWTGGRF